MCYSRRWKLERVQRPAFLLQAVEDRVDVQLVRPDGNHRHVGRKRQETGYLRQPVLYVASSGNDLPRPLHVTLAADAHHRCPTRADRACGWNKYTSDPKSISRIDVESSFLLMFRKRSDLFLTKYTLRLLKRVSQHLSNGTNNFL